MNYFIALMIGVFALTSVYAAEEKKVCVKEFDNKTNKENKRITHLQARLVSTLYYLHLHPHNNHHSNYHKIINSIKTFQIYHNNNSSN